MGTIHILGADIPHHNTTLLTFFDQVLATEVPCSQARRFLVVTQNATLSEQFPQLSIHCVESKKKLASVVTALAKDRQTVFFCHGQFNPYLWLALLSGKIRKHQLHWHVWGADLYEESRALKFRLFYVLRRLAQGRVAAVYATLGDLSVYQQKHPNVPTHKLYFPTKMASTASVVTDRAAAPFTILLGNSGDPTNRHCQALTQIAQQFDQPIHVIIPMGYPENNQPYIDRVRQHAAQHFSAGQVEILTEKLCFDDYLQLLARCHLGYFIFARQQGIGTLSLLIEKNIPFVISRQNPFWRDLAEQRLPLFFDQDRLEKGMLQRAHQQLVDYDKTTIAFFSPGYLQGWHQVLDRLEGMGT